jgi:hypothetical protein
MTSAPAPELPSVSGERLVPNERTAHRIIDGKAVVITIDENQVHVLNGVGTRVWELCDGRALDEIVDQIVLEFEVERSRALADVHAFARQLVAVGAAQLIGGPA